MQGGTSCSHIERTTASQCPLQIGEIVAQKRVTVGSKHAQASRQQHLIPGIIYGFDEGGNEDVELVSVQESDLRREVNKRGACFYNTLFDV